MGNTFLVSFFLEMISSKQENGVLFLLLSDSTSSIQSNSSSSNSNSLWFLFRWSHFLSRDFFDLSKHNISTINCLLSYKIPKLRTFHSIFIADKYTFFSSFVIQLGPFLLWISITTKKFRFLIEGFLPFHTSYGVLSTNLDMGDQFTK